MSERPAPGEIPGHKGGRESMKAFLKCSTGLNSELHVANYVTITLRDALCHAIRADCLLIEAARAHAVNEQWTWPRIDKFACTFKPVRRGSLC